MTELRYDGTVVLVTGVAVGGLGFAYARSLADRGATVVVNDLGVDWAGNRTTAGTDEAVRLLSEEGGSVTGVTGDVLHEADRIVGEVIDQHGKLDVLVNNAGAGGDFDTMLDVHVRGTFRMSEAAWPWLEKSDAGRIVNTASNSTWGLDGPPGYPTAKSAIIALTRVQARNGRAAGISANVVLPSAWANSTAGLPDKAVGAFLEKRFGAEHVAGFVAYLCHASSTVTGQAFSVGGGVAARVVQAKSRGAVSLDASPDAWAGLIDEVMDSEHLVVPPSMWGDVGLLAGRIGPDAQAEFDELDFTWLGGI